MIFDWLGTVREAVMAIERRFILWCLPGPQDQISLEVGKLQCSVFGLLKAPISAL